MMKTSVLKRDWTVLLLIDYEKIRKDFVSGLKEYCNCSMIRQNQAVEPPPYDYLGYTITTLMSENKGTYGIYEDGTARKPFTQIWSISSFSDDDTKAALLAAKAREWVDLVGTTYLNDRGIIVQSVGAITNRDNLLTYGYEYRKGFDVVLWLFDTVDEISGEYIETYEPNIKEIGGESNGNT